MELVQVDDFFAKYPIELVSIYKKSLQLKKT